MAIFTASTKSITRSKGQSAVACAAYRAGVKLEDKRYGKTHDYSKRQGVMSADIILPTSLKNKGATIDRGELWNLAEESETRKNSRVAREWLINLPHELDEKTRKELAHTFAQALADKFNVIADCAIHKPTDKEIERGADPRNFHAHIMLTTRKAALDENNNVILTSKSACELSDTDRKKYGLNKAKDEVKEIRLLWEQIANAKLEKHNHNLIDSRSYAEQGIDILPQIKMGVAATHLERRTGETSIRGEVNRLIAERNELVWGAELAKHKRTNDAADQTIADLREKNKAADMKSYMEQGKKRAKALYEDWKREEEESPRIEKTQPNIDTDTAEVTRENPLQAKYQQWKAQREQDQQEIIEHDKNTRPPLTPRR